MPIGIYNYERKIKIKPKLEMTENLAYLLGAIKGDGSISNNKKYVNSTQLKRHNKTYKNKLYQIKFFNQNIEFLKRIFGFMRDIGLNPSIYYGKTEIQLHSCSKIMWEWLYNLKIYDLNNILKQDKGYILSFLRGFYEAEGCYFYETGINYPYAVITNANEELISFVHTLICELGFRPKIYKIKRGKTAFKKGFYFHILIRRKGEAERFIKMINPFFKNEPSNKWF